jgi:prolyl-tRNA editing enzyme YbaK/EbsC (Cys-tRNA(Pro) deacylase)
MMIEDVVRYLRRARVPFRAISYVVAPEAQPSVAHRLPPGAQLVDAHVVLVDGRPAIACIQSGEMVNLAAMTVETGGTVTEASPAEIFGKPDDAPVLVPPLGGVFGVPLFVDERVARAPLLAFRAFDANDYVEVLYEDFARLERPRVAAFADAGELPP